MRALRAAAARPLPGEAERAARLHLLDAIGVGLAAAGSPAGAAYLGLADRLASGGPSTVFGRGHGAAPADAALVNGGLMHSLEFDDTHTGSIMHGSSVIAAAALACAEAEGASGAALLGAYARGWEALVRFGLAAPGGFHAKGFQATSVAGALAAALVAAELGGASEEEALGALGIALSQSSGVMEFLANGSSVKSLHPGWAAHGGVLAAMLARSGMTGPETALEGRHGLFRQFAGDERAAERMAAQVADIGRVWHLPQAAYKFHPCCHYLHPFIEAAGVLAERGVRAAEVSAILCGVPAGAAPVICEPWERKRSPETPHEARWSLPIVIAARLVQGRVDLRSFEEPLAPEVRALARRIRWEPLEGARFPERFEAELRCELDSGAIETVRVDDAYGNRSRPADAAAVLEKFHRNAARVLAPEAAETLVCETEALAAAGDLAAFSRALRRAHRATAAS